MSITTDFKTWIKEPTSRRTNEVDAIIARNVQELRDTKNISKVQLAARLRITLQQLVKYENATNRISASRLVAIAKALDCPVSDFFAGTS